MKYIKCVSIVPELKAVCFYIVLENSKKALVKFVLNIKYKYVPQVIIRSLLQSHFFAASSSGAACITQLYCPAVASRPTFCC